MLAALAICVVIVVMHELGREPADIAATPTPAVGGPTRGPKQTPAPSALPEPNPTVEVVSDWVVVAVTTPTPTTNPTALPTPTRRDRRPTPTPGVTSCVRFGWSAGQSAAAWGQILVEIRVENGCGRTLQPLELWFRVSGWRDGAEVHHSQGHAFNELRPGGREEVIIGLPGSLDWYHELRVELLDTPLP